MPARIHKLPEVGEIIDDMIVTEVYRDAKKKFRVKCRCQICGREKDIDFISGIVSPCILRKKSRKRLRHRKRKCQVPQNLDDNESANK